MGRTGKVIIIVVNGVQGVEGAFPGADGPADDEVGKQRFQSGQPHASIRCQRHSPLSLLSDLRLPEILQRPLPAPAPDQQVRRARSGGAHQPRGRVISTPTNLLLALHNNNHMNADLAISPSDLLCYICQDYFCRPLSAACGHSFCQYCIQEYLLYAEICPICSQKVREKPLNPLPCLGEFVENFLMSDRKEMKRLQERKEAVKDYQKRREIKSIKVGMKIDIRDSNYIWCEGMVMRMISKIGQPTKWLRISYLKYIEKKEEDVPIFSQRLANQGFFTKRNDIPHYSEQSLAQPINKYHS